MPSSHPPYLTKSRFKLGMECPAKLYYTAKPEYPDNKMDDPFLTALAEGGFQVGELAKQYYPDGIDLGSHSKMDALEETTSLLQRDSVTIFEAAILHENLYILADILIKDGDHFELIEVKSKSYTPDKDADFIAKRGGIISSWKPYLYDVAFQKYVLSSAFPSAKVDAYLMLADKTAPCPTDGLHQKFKIVKNANGRSHCEVAEPLSKEELSNRILCKVNVNDVCTKIYREPLEDEKGPASFKDRIKWLAAHYDQDKKIPIAPFSGCAKCEFNATKEQEAAGLKSGFKECWKQSLGWHDGDFDEPNVLEIWNFRRKDKLIAEGKIKVSTLHETDIGAKSGDKPGLSQSERQWLQVEKAQAKDASIWIDKEGLRNEMDSWQFPLHMIDFETSRVAIPFHKSHVPYEQVAFQFSHHVIEADGTVRHQGQYLCVEAGKNPNYEFVRELKKALEGDEGTIFRYATHENSTLVALHELFEQDPNPPTDRQDLLNFIQKITYAKAGKDYRWNGSRSMVDLKEAVVRYFYAPSTKGSNSLKYVLPAILNASQWLQEKYSKPIYGGSGTIQSLNFAEPMTWIQMEEGQVKDPYRCLPKMFEGLSNHDFEILEEDELRDGGAAMTAYAKIQYTDLSDIERTEIQKALLRYCELDTLAMVMVYEAWKKMIN